MEIYLERGDGKEALTLLELLIYALNKKQIIRPSQIFYTQVIANLY